MSVPVTSINGVDLAAVGELGRQLAADPAAGASTSPVGNTIERPVTLDARLVKTPTG